MRLHLGEREHGPALGPHDRDRVHALPGPGSSLARSALEHGVRLVPQRAARFGASGLDLFEDCDLAALRPERSGRKRRRGARVEGRQGAVEHGEGFVENLVKRAVPAPCLAAQVEQLIREMPGQQAAGATAGKIEPREHGQHPRWHERAAEEPRSALRLNSGQLLRRDFEAGLAERGQKDPAHIGQLCIDSSLEIEPQSWHAPQPCGLGV